eukprot:2436590-Prymnesium_polylepis.1
MVDRWCSSDHLKQCDASHSWCLAWYWGREFAPRETRRPLSARIECTRVHTCSTYGHGRMPIMAHFDGRCGVCAVRAFLAIDSSSGATSSPGNDDSK